MEIESPTLGINEAASVALIRSTIPNLKDRDDPFVILSSNEYTFMQALWTKDGYALEYQENDIDHHFESRFMLESDEIIQAFVEYLSGSQDWRDRTLFRKKRVRSMPNQFGFWIGRLLRPFIDYYRGFKAGYARARKKS